MPQTGGNMRKLISTPSILTCFLLISAPVYAEDYAWQTLQSDACGGFTVNMPGTAKEVSHADKEVIMRGYSMDDWPEGVFTVACIVYLPDAKVEIENELTTNRDNFDKEAQATLISESSTSLQGVPGIDFTSQSDKHRANYRVRVFSEGNRVYLISAGTRKGHDEMVNMQKFLDSFHLTNR
jgi:hypothetical protein